MSWKVYVLVVSLVLSVAVGYRWNREPHTPDATPVVRSSGIDSPVNVNDAPLSADSDVLHDGLKVAGIAEDAAAVQMPACPVIEPPEGAPCGFGSEAALRCGYDYARRSVTCTCQSASEEPRWNCKAATEDEVQDDSEPCPVKQPAHANECGSPGLGCVYGVGDAALGCRCDPGTMTWVCVAYVEWLD